MSTAAFPPALSVASEGARDVRWEDEILELLAENKRAPALLILHRNGNGHLPDAWVALNELADDSRFDKPGQDPAYIKVQQYLGVKSPWRETLAVYSAGTLVILLGFGLMCLAWPRFKTGWDSYSWPDRTATILNVRMHEVTTYQQDREVTKQYLSYQYEYEVDGEIYRNTVTKEPFYEVFGDRFFKLGEEIRVVFNPDRPQHSIHKRFMYDRTFWMVVGFAIALLGTCFVSLLAHFSLADRSLRKWDPSLHAS